MNRRDWLTASAATGGAALVWSRQRKFERDFRPQRSRVASLRAEAYSDDLDQLVLDEQQWIDA